MAARIEYSEKYQDDSFEYRCEGHSGCIKFPLARVVVASFAVYVRKAQKSPAQLFVDFRLNVDEKVGLISDKYSHYEHSNTT